MTLADIQAMYPGCENAILIEELPGKELFWEARRLRGVSIEEAVSSVKRLVTDSLAMWSDSGDPERVEVARKAAEEMDTNNFRLYVAGKLGAM